jgi:hypothetical protein
MHTLTQPQEAALIGAGVVALCLIVVLFLRISRRHRRPAKPLPITTSPYLESPDGHVMMPLTTLTGMGSIIGRGPNADLVVDDTLPQACTVSERHARIFQDAATGYVMIEDLDSTNGVFVNGRRAPRKNLLKDRWTVGLGSLTLVYRDGNSDTGPLE